jgi:hypothetical protein
MTRNRFSIPRARALLPLVFGLLGHVWNPGPADAQTSLSTWAQLRLEELQPPDSQGEQGLGVRLERIRALYFLSVDEGKWADIARDSLSALKANIPSASEEEVTFEAYRGALQVVRAKHARWPPNKLKHLDKGARILDGLVDREPENLEVRYLRLASYLFLPFFLRRDDSVAADLGTLVADLPEKPGAFSPALYQAVVEFVLENGSLEAEEKARLEGTLGERQPTGLNRSPGYLQSQGRQGD